MLISGICYLLLLRQIIVITMMFFLPMQSLTISKSRNVLISGLTSLNSKLVHISIQNSREYITVQDSWMIAPKDSPNTDGVHILMSSGVSVTPFCHKDW